MRRNVVLAGSIAALLLLAACSSQGGGPSGSPSATPTPTATVATTLDPCQLVTAAEASTLSGATFGAGLEETTGTNGTGKRCTYGSQTTNVFFVQVASSDNAADAQAAWATEEAAADADIASGFGGVTANFTKTDLTGLGEDGWRAIARILPGIGENPGVDAARARRTFTLLAAHAIGTQVYYPIPLHLQPCFASFGGREGDLPHAERAAREVLALPLYPELDAAQQESVVDAIAAFYAG